MIIVNGYIESKVETGGGLDEDGNPVAASYVWGVRIPCRYKPNKNSMLGKSNGNTFNIATYDILIDRQPLDADQIRLSDVSGAVLGEFSVMWIETLDAVEALKIIV